jgi:PAS domain S-box-containing protein
MTISASKLELNSLLGSTENKKVWPSVNFKLDLNSLKLNYDSIHQLQLMEYGFSNVKLEYTLLEYSELYIHPDDIPLIHERYNYAILNHHSPDYYDRFELRLKTPIAGIINLLLSIYSDETGVIKGSILDITEYKNVISEKNSQETIFYSVIDNTSDYVFVLDKEQRLFKWNKSFEDIMLRYLNVKMVYGMDLSSLIPEEKQCEWIEMFIQALQGEEIVRQLSLDLNKRYYYDVLANPIPSANNEFSGVAFWVKDVTSNRLKAELDQLEGRTLTQALEQDDLEDIVYVLLNGIEELTPSLFTYTTLFDQEKSCLNWLSAPKIPINYTEKTNQISIHENAGCCGAAVYNRKPYFETDIANSKNWREHRDLTLLYGFKSCFSYPIINSSGEILGTLGCFLKEARELEHVETELLERATRISGVLIDRHMAIQNVKKKSKQFEEITDSLNGIIYELRADLEGNRRFTFIKGSFFDLFGFEVKEMLDDYSFALKFVHPDDVNHLMEALERSIEELKPWICEFRIQNQTTNLYHWFRVNSNQKIESDGTRTSFGTLLKIDDLKEEEQKRENKIIHLDAIISSSSNLHSFEISKDGEILDVWSSNNNQQSLLRKISIGSSLFSLFDDEFELNLRIAIDELIDQKKSVDFEFVSKELAEPQILLGHLYQIPKNDTTAPTYYFSCSDISHSKKLDDSKNTIQLNTILQNLKVGSWHYDFDSNQFKFTNQLCDLLNIQNSDNENELMLQFYKCVDSKDVQLLEKSFSDAVEFGNNFSIEFRTFDNENAPRWFLCSAQLLQDDHGSFLMGFMQEITEKKKLETQIETLLDEKNNNDSILSFKIDKVLEIQKSIRKLELLYSSTELNTSSVNPSNQRWYNHSILFKNYLQNKDSDAIDFSQLTSELIDYIAKNNAENSSKVKVNLHLSIHVLTSFKAFILGFMLSELVNNVYKHAFINRENGLLDISLEEGGGFIIMKIKDNGVGFVKNATNDKVSTLGMKVLDILVKSLEGHIDIKSELGVGTTAVITVSK